MINATHNLKHRALISLAYSSGMRRNEVKLMKPTHIDSDRMRVYVAYGKGKKTRYTLLSQKALQLLRMYFRLVNLLPSCLNLREVKENRLRIRP